MMWSNDAALGQSRRPRLLDATVGGLGALLTATLFLGAFGGGLRKPARVEVEAAAPVMAGWGAPARPPVPGMCFHGAGGELLDLAPSGQRCP